MMLAIYRAAAAVSALWTVLCLAASPSNITAYDVSAEVDMLRAQLKLLGDRPPECPPCFNCHLPVFSCGQYALCNDADGTCKCPDGFGGDDCLEPLCGSLGSPSRPIRDSPECVCDEGWTGVNCNVCTGDQACNALMPNGEGGVCYQGGDAVKHNFQMCDVTNDKIRTLLGQQVPQVTFTCSQDDDANQCDFQFWVDQRESFMCHLDKCTWSAEFDERKNATSYKCDKISCECIADRMLCGENGSVDLTDFLNQEIRGPASFECTQQRGGQNKCAFREPQMDELITSLIGDESIMLTCRSGECLYHTDVPGYKRPVPRINTPLIAGVIAGSALFLVAVILSTWYLSRRSFRYGAIHLDDSDDEATKLMTDHKPASLQFSNAAYAVNGKQVLSGIQGVAYPGEITAIMGASGAGKTTFLDILARKNKRGLVSGDIHVNGVQVSESDYRKVVGFVDQEDTMLPTLTVHETILTSALLRLPRDMSQAAKEQRVIEVEKQLGIYHIRDSLIGSEEGHHGRGISGGEKRRVGIACELVTSPSILFLDEPTTGLDAYNAFNVIECLVTLAKTYRRTVIFTIHQPRSNIVALFDRLILLAKGKTVYSGPFAQCQSYFDDIGYSCPQGFNIADYLVDLTMHAGTSTSFDDAPIAAADAASLGPSSTRAVKSIASISAQSLADESGADTSPPSSRPNKRPQRSSIRAIQERELFTRRRYNVDTAASSDAGGEEVGAYRLQRQHTQPTTPLLHITDASDGLPALPATANRTELDYLVQSFSESDMASSLVDEIQQSVAAARDSNGRNGESRAAGDAGATDASGVIGKGYARVGLWRQFTILSRRTFRNLYRNPMLMLTHYAIAILLAVFSGWLFYGLTLDIGGFQNRLGLFFFVLSLFGFSTLTNLNVFAAERLLFTRERANGYYAPVTYFAAKVIFDIVPLRIIPPLLLGAIVYPMTGLVPEAGHFFTFLLVLVLFNLAAAAICLFIGIVCKDNGVANLIGSLVMLFSLLFAGLLLNHNKIPAGAIWLQWLSIFHYAFEALIVNEVRSLTLVDTKYGLDITVPGAAILSSFGFNNGAMWMDIVNLAIFGGIFIILAYAAMHVLLVEKR